MAHATKDHILRVANEADFILNRLRAEDVSKHTQFDNESDDQLVTRKLDSQNSDHLIVASRRRNYDVADKLLEKMRNILINPTVWSDDSNKSATFQRLDQWEDDSRRRKRFVPNAYGSTHPDASIYTQKTPEPPSSDNESEEDSKLKDLGHKMLTNAPKNSQANAELVDEADITEEIEPAEQRQGLLF